MGSRVVLMAAMAAICKLLIVCLTGMICLPHPHHVVQHAGACPGKASLQVISWILGNLREVACLYGLC